MEASQNGLRLGIDVGSTTVKLVILDVHTNQVLFSCYRRHNAKQADAARRLLEEAAAAFPATRFRIAVCGSGGRPIAEALGVHYIQEVVANAAAVRCLYPEARTAVELGGQDAKIVFFHFDAARKRLLTSDMRMNGSCAGGTGAFIDEVAALLNVPVDGFEALAAEGRTVYDISGRCGVFAKTDIQPLLIQGAAREDIALSTFHAIVKQTIGGLSQGLELTPPIIFEGGPLTFNPSLVRVFMERLSLKASEVICPEHPETIVARGTAIALDELFPSADEEAENLSLQEAAEMLRIYHAGSRTEQVNKDKAFFASREERDAFDLRHKKQPLYKAVDIQAGGTLRSYLGIDSGSTTSKVVLMDEEENVTDTFYSHNHGDPLRVVRDGLLALYDKYRARGIKLDILGLGTTGYGELLFAKAFGADYHTVETVAHAQGCKKFIPDVSFLLDIGGQDMKAIWINDGVVTNITLNEACSSGCGSFLENFAISLRIPVERIAEAAFHSRDPAVLGSRCTVFMNSMIINEQRNGKQTDDIMAGLCRSIIENVFTKVVRILNVAELGNRIVVQGGTFRNRAVLRALEEYLGKEVVLAPYPGEMGALGAAIAAKHFIEEHGYANGSSSSFIGFEAVAGFDYIKKDGVSCPLCTNHCSRTVMKFSTGARWTTGNRCERGAIVSDMKEELSSKVNQTELAMNVIPDMFQLRQNMLFRDYDYKVVSTKKETIIGLPRVLEFWDSMPFWTTFFHALGFKTKISHPSSRRLYEQGLPFVASDTICFPAKLVHGHIRDLAEQSVDRIFMPLIMHMPPEGTDKLSPYVCSIIMGYPMVVRNFDSPERRFHISFDTPTFHWFTEQDRKRQICEYAVHSLQVTRKEAEAAFSQADAAITTFRAQLVQEGQRILDDVRTGGGFAVVLAGRPYHTDPFICHNISHLFTKQGIPVLTVDGLPGLNKVDLHHTRAEVTNNFHTRMLSGAVHAALTPELEYVQIVSFGCGHDAILSDEVVRIMTEGSGKPPLVLKVDESDATGSLGIRVQSFVETVQIRRRKDSQEQASRTTFGLLDPYPAKFYRKDKKLRTVLIPNISGEVSKLLSGLLSKEGFRVKTIPVGDIEQIRLGKKYTHNDICFPCQMVIGELIAELQKGGYKPDEVAVGMAKFQCDCRLSHYAALLRNALDSAGFVDVPILSTDPNDTKEMHPGVSLFSLTALIEAIWTFMMLDILDDLRRKIRPYELHPGETNRVFDECIDNIAEEIRNGLLKAIGAFRSAIDAFCKIPYDRHTLKPQVLVTGELLVTYHPGSNFYIENYLERNGMETIFPRITNQFRKDFLASICEIRDFKVKIPPYSYVLNKVFDFAQASMEKIALAHPLYHRALRPRDLYEGVRDIIPETLSCGEGWLMAAEIVHYAAEGVRSFVILQPFGCLPNHICGRGVTKRIKDDFPSIQILPLDLDPDTSFANIENRLQMLIMNNQEFHKSRHPAENKKRASTRKLAMH